LFSFYILFCIHILSFVLKNHAWLFFSSRVIGGWKPEYPEENHPSQSLKEEVNQCLTRFGDPLPSKPNWYRTIGNPCKCQAKPPSYGTKSWTWQSHGVRSQDIEFPQKRSWALNRSSPGLQIEKSETKPSDRHAREVFFDNFPSSAASLEFSGTNPLEISWHFTKFSNPNNNPNHGTEEEPKVGDLLEKKILKTKYKGRIIMTTRSPA